MYDGTKGALGLVLMLTFSVFAHAQAVPEPSPRKTVAKPVSPLPENNALREPEPVRDERIYQSACPVLMDGHIQGKTVASIRNGRCGERSPLEVTGIGEMELSAPVVTNCRMATRVHAWANALQDLAKDQFDSAIASIEVSTSYQCRRRNNAPDGKISEHGFANALDVTGFTLENGQQISILEDWGATLGKDATQDIEINGDIQSTKETSQALIFLRKAHQLGCERFTTVLGPMANPLHRDHFHLDLGCHGKKCTYLICE